MRYFLFLLTLFSVLNLACSDDEGGGEERPSTSAFPKARVQSDIREFLGVSGAENPNMLELQAIKNFLQSNKGYSSCQLAFAEGSINEFIHLKRNELRQARLERERNERNSPGGQLARLTAIELTHRRADPKFAALLQSEITKMQREDRAFGANGFILASDGHYVSRFGFNYLVTGEVSNNYIVQDYRNVRTSCGFTRNKFGFDAAGRESQLSYAWTQSNERYDKDGFSLEGINYVGIGRDDWESDSYDAIVKNNMVEDESGETIEDGDALVSLFNRACYQLKKMDYIEMDMRDVNDFEVLKGAISEGASASAPGFSGFGNLSEQRLKGFLKKSIHMCKFLYYGGLPRELPLARLSVARGERLTKLLLPIDYEKKLRDAQALRPLNFFDKITRRLIKTDVLTSAALRYELPPEVLYKLPAELLRTLLEVYKDDSERSIDVGRGLEYHKMRYLLYRIAETIDTKALASVAQAAGELFQGGGYCDGAKKGAIKNAAGILRDDLLSELNREEVALNGAGINSKLKIALAEKKAEKLSEWIRRVNEVWRAFGDDLAQNTVSTFNATWAAMGGALGLAAEPYKHPNYDLLLDTNKFFDERSRGGEGYTPKFIIGNDGIRAILEPVRELVFGPLAVLREGILRDHPLFNAILVRFGFLEYV